MTTSEFIVCEILGCGQYDIESCFGSMDDDILTGAIKHCKDDFGTYDAGAIWQIAIEDAATQVFGDYEFVEPEFNYMASSVSFVGDPEEIEDFDSKVEEFENLTGFSLNY